MAESIGYQQVRCCLRCWCMDVECQ